jgi:hypothetical protein
MVIALASVQKDAPWSSAQNRHPGQFSLQVEPMRIFTCTSCGNTLFFENVRCTDCGHTLAYFPDHGVVSAIEPIETQGSRTAADSPLIYRALLKQVEGEYRLCANSSEYGICNSAVPVEDPEPLCQACRLNDVVPDVSDPKAVDAWQALERWKRAMLYTLRELGLPIESRKERPENGLMFSFMSDSPDGKNKVFTGHSDGLITINVAEADDPFREKLRKQLGEGYRTVLGHFRHEIGHYYWDRLIRDSPWLPAYRGIFGDESVDYQESVQRHYAQGAPADWPQHYVSSYATMHPWEDWAETWAHYLHIIDTLGTARAYGLVLRPKPDGRASSDLSVAARSLDFYDFDALMAGWVPVTVALNSLNRSMGLIDPYPFVLCADVIEKLRFVHDVVRHWNSSVDKRNNIIAAWLEQKPWNPPAPQPKPVQQTPEPAIGPESAVGGQPAAAAQPARPAEAASAAPQKPPTGAPARA